jgi:predicted transposase YdaD
MEQRLLEYSVLACRHHQCSVCSVVIYLKEGGKVAISPLVRILPDGEEVLRFHFRVILLWDIPYQDLIAEGLPGILPLVPLARGGAKREVIEEVIARLMPEGKPARKELLALTRLFASLAFESKEDQEWLGRKFDMLKDILRDTPAYKQILEEGLEEGLEKGLKEGREQGRKEGIEKERQERLQSLRSMILDLVQTRYPTLMKLAKGQTTIIEQPKTLEVLLVRVAQAATTEEAQNVFLTWEEQ